MFRFKYSTIRPEIFRFRFQRTRHSIFRAECTIYSYAVELYYIIRCALKPCRSFDCAADLWQLFIYKFSAPRLQLRHSSIVQTSMTHKSTADTEVQNNIGAQTPMPHKSTADTDVQNNIGAQTPMPQIPTPQPEGRNAARAQQ